MENPLINADIGKLSEPLTKLIQTVGEGIGGVYRPLGTILNAKAEAKAEQIKAQSEELTADIALRAKHRIQYQEVLQQQNLEQIIAKAANQIPENVSEKPVEVDWTLQFIDYAKNVTDEEMQSLWAKILAGEVAEPGTFSKRCLAFAHTLERHEALNFVQVCNLAFTLDKWPVLFSLKATDRVLKDTLTNEDFIQHFINIGLLNTEKHVLDCKAQKVFEFNYHSANFKLERRKADSNNFLRNLFPFRYFTAIGKQLHSIANPRPVPNYIELFRDEVENDYDLTLMSE